MNIMFMNILFTENLRKYNTLIGKNIGFSLCGYNQSEKIIELMKCIGDQLEMLHKSLYGMEITNQSNKEHR